MSDLTEKFNRALKKSQRAQPSTSPFVTPEDALKIPKKWEEESSATQSKPDEPLTQTSPEPTPEIKPYPNWLNKILRRGDEEILRRLAMQQPKKQTPAE